MVDNYTVIEGSVKFRDGKKWKSRWCVMRKLSPVADCLHLQLYRDSRDRYKQGQTKASLSLQHFLGVQSGFTLDKESNTIAIICQDVTVVLAFDTRERLIQWQVKIANNLGEDEQFLVQISTAPLRAKLSPGPALLHVLEYQFCLTVGVPPRLIGCWQISQLRRYGVVEARFCFEGGSRCGKGEGLYVLVTDQGEEITRTFCMAAEGKLSSKKRPASRNASDSPKKSVHGRAETRLSEVSCLDTLLQGTSGGEDDLLSCSWQLSEPPTDFADASSVADFTDSYSKENTIWMGENGMERCASCISKLGALSRSSTAAMTPNSTFTPAWTMEANSSGAKQEAVRGGCGEAVSQNPTASQASSGGEGSSVKTAEAWNTKDGMGIERCQCCPPVRPPKPRHLSSSSPQTSVTSSPKKRKNLPPDTASCTCNITVNPYDNYDVPKGPQGQECSKDHNCHWTQNLTASDPEYYDTPKSIRENFVNEFGNYDTPPPVLMERKQMCTTLQKNQYLARVVIDNDEMHMMACPCQRVMCWAENWMFLPYCRRGNGRENTAPPLHKKITDGGSQPLQNNLSSTVYATVDKSKKIRNRLHDNEFTGDESEDHTLSSNKCNNDFLQFPGYENMSRSGTERKTGLGKNQETHTNTAEGTQNYMNSDFMQSLEFYENSKDFMQKSNRTHHEFFTEREEAKSSSVNSISHPSDNTGVKICTKCKNECKWPPPNPRNRHDDYLMMEPSATENSTKNFDQTMFGFRGKHVPGYIPMHPIGTSSCMNNQDMLKFRKCTQMMHSTERAASSPSLIDQSAEMCRRKSDIEAHRLPGATVFGINHSVSAANSPYLRRRVLGCVHESAEIDGNNQGPRKRSCSADSTNNLGGLDYVPNKPTPSHNPQEVAFSKNTSTDTLYSNKTVAKKCVDFDIAPIMSDNERSNENTCSSSSVVKEPSCRDTGQYENIDWARIALAEPLVHIRRSSSVPSKSTHNRDSSSSNDSGVSTSSLKKRKSDFVESNNQTGKSGPIRRYTYTRGDKKLLCECFHSSLPRRSKSGDLNTARELAFQFQQVEVPMKSSSAEAEVPIHPKRESRGCLSPGVAVPYIDSRSTSSGTSDMSDYFETLSLSSYSSSDTPDSLHFGHHAVSTMRPRSGKEYQKIDRAILDSELQRGQMTSGVTKEGASASDKESGL